MVGIEDKLNFRRTMECIEYITLLTIQPRDSGILCLLQIKVTYSQPIGEIHVMEASKIKNRKKSHKSCAPLQFSRK
jgi:hypothetical protein